MKTSTIILLLAPVALSSPTTIGRRQGKGKAGGGSGQVCFVYARGSMEPSPMVSLCISHLFAFGLRFRKKSNARFRNFFKRAYNPDRNSNPLYAYDSQA
jgi:hypothetical protein